MLCKEALPPRQKFCVKSLLRENRGYSLVELLVAVIIFSIIMLAIFRLFAFSTMQNRRSNDLNELHSIAQRSMEYLKYNTIIEESSSYQVLTDYTVDATTKNRFMVIFTARKKDVPSPTNEPELSADLMTKIENYDVTLEVYFKQHESVLGLPDTNSKVPLAKEKNLPIITLQSQVVQYED